MKTSPLLLLVAVLLAACASAGPISHQIAVGGAAMVAVFDQLLAGGAIDQMQHFQLTQGITSIDATVDALQKGVEAVEKAQTGAITTGEATAAAGGMTAALLAAVRAWRGPATKKA